MPRFPKPKFNRPEIHVVFIVVERADGGVLRVRGRLQAGQPAVREYAAGGATGTLPQPCPPLQASQVRHPFY